MTGAVARLHSAVSSRIETRMPITERTLLKTGEEYRAALRDGRDVWYLGERVADVTTHPATAGGVSLIAEAYDAHHEPAHREALTYVRDDGARVTKAWMIPRTREDLRRRRECVEHLARETFGVFGRQMDMIAATQVGMVAFDHLVREHCPAYAGHAATYVEWAAEQGIMLAAPLADPQGWRSRGSALGRRGIPLYDEEGEPGASALTLTLESGHRMPSTLGVVRTSAEGMWISGAKVVGSAAPQCQEMLVSNVALPDPTPDRSLWMLVPAGSEGVRLLCRESTARPGASRHDHPISSRGEEMDALVLFDEVFVPHWRICSYGWTGLSRRYGEIAALEHWHTLTRLCVKAELFVGLAQLVCDGIGTSHRPGVRQLIAELIEYAQILRGMVLASEESARLTASGVMWPDANTITAGRSYALSRYAQIVRILQDLAGQGPVLRWSERDLDHPELGPQIAWLYEGASLPAREKNRLMNLLWDLTASSHAGRVALFEGVNGFPVPYLRERMYLDYDREGAMEHIERFLGFPDPGR
jgi:4-hydroxyphenylacetate 3-monooxygenase